MIYIIGCNGYIGSNLMQAIPGAVGIARGTKWPVFDRDDWVINAASYFWHGRVLDKQSAYDTNCGIPYILHTLDCNIIQLTSTAASAQRDNTIWKYKILGDCLLLGKAHILILPTIYGGINQHKHMFMTALLDHILHGTPFKLETPDAMRDFVHIGELITCIKDIIALRFRAIRKPHRLTSGNEISMLTMLRITEGIAAELRT